jgi:hypothetical protein
MCRKTTIISERLREEKPRTKGPMLSDRSLLVVENGADDQFGDVRMACRVDHVP